VSIRSSSSLAMAERRADSGRVARVGDSRGQSVLHQARSRLYRCRCDFKGFRQEAGRTGVREAPFYLLTPASFRHTRRVSPRVAATSPSRRWHCPSWWARRLSRNGSTISDRRAILCCQSRLERRGVRSVDSADSMTGGSDARAGKRSRGHLTATIHGTEDDFREHEELLAILEQKVGRIVFNGFPTGVKSARNGPWGPYPATSGWAIDVSRDSRDIPVHAAGLLPGISGFWSAG
jgi:hypothetical protein